MFPNFSLFYCIRWSLHFLTFCCNEWIGESRDSLVHVYSIMHRHSSFWVHTTSKWKDFFRDICFTIGFNSIHNGKWFEQAIIPCWTTMFGNWSCQATMARQRSSLSLMHASPSLLLQHVNLGPLKPKLANSHSFAVVRKSDNRLSAFRFPPHFSLWDITLLKSPHTNHLSWLCWWIIRRFSHVLCLLPDSGKL